MKPTYQTWLETLPTHLRDEGAAAIDGTASILEHLAVAYQYGRDSRDLEVTILKDQLRENEARIDGYKTALQDKLQIHHNVINPNKKRWWQR